VPRVINQETYYTIIEVCREAGISKSTLLRWLREGSILDELPRDRRGWRVFRETDLAIIKNEADRLC
jgi:excisionase family DNA binding protein